MARHKVTVFEPYPFQAGRKIHIEEGPRRGDWEVISVTDRKVTLRCPVSLREIEWDRFCYFVSEGENIEWPKQD